jgi:hypothetical protein
MPSMQRVDSQGVHYFLEIKIGILDSAILKRSGKERI